MSLWTFSPPRRIKPLLTFAPENIRLQKGDRVLVFSAQEIEGIVLRLNTCDLEPSVLKPVLKLDPQPAILELLMDLAAEMAQSEQCLLAATSG